MDVFQWIAETLHPRVCTSEEFIYDDMDSQSARSLPVIYEPFDAGRRSHWRDRGALFDFLHAVRGEGKRLLDFGPGDGWPSLLVATFAREVIGVEGSARRVSTCTENAERLGAGNARFVFVSPGSPIPFDDQTFDGIMAASSVEQTPDPRATVSELFRVLRPGGRLRICYESLAGYRNGQERDVWLWQIDPTRRGLVLFDRDIEGERVRQYSLTYAASKQDLAKSLSPDGRPLSFEMITVRALEAVAASLLDARVCDTIHPSGETLARWLRDCGFAQVNPTHSGADAAGMLFDAMSEKERPTDLRGVDALVRPVAEVASELAAPLDTDPMITAVK
jgi:ubiquinone/menaquinone biosynthesis C-methylase UbiE